MGSLASKTSISRGYSRIVACLVRSQTPREGSLLNLLDAKVQQRGGRVIKVGRFFPSSTTCHSCGWKWEDMQLSDRVFLCQNPKCASHQFEQDRDYNAALNILREALHLIGLLEQVVTGIGSDEDGNLTADAGEDQKGSGLQAPTVETGTTKAVGKLCLHMFYYRNRSRNCLVYFWRR